MEFMKKLIFIAVAVAAMAAGMAGCSDGEKSGESKAAVNAGNGDVTALAKQAAEQIVNAPRGDTLAVQEAIMEARAQRSKLAIAGHTEAAEAYDKALHDHLMKLDAQLCNTIFANK